MPVAEVSRSWTRAAVAPAFKISGEGDKRCPIVNKHKATWSNELFDTPTQPVVQAMRQLYIRINIF